MDHDVPSCAIVSMIMERESVVKSKGYHGRMLSEQLLDTAEVGRLLGITPNALRKLLHRRTLTIPAKKVGARWRFKRSDVEAFLATWPVVETPHA